MSILDFFNPLYIDRRSLFENISSVAPKVKGVVLDVGCGQKPYESLFVNSKKYIGIDHFKSKSDPNSKADFYFDGKKFPFKSNTFDSIVCTQVLEHVEDVELFISELKRVLKKGGSVLLTAPFVWEEHEEPYDFSRFSSFGVKNILIRNGFKIEIYKKSTSSILAIFQMNNLVVSNIGLKNILFKILSKIFVFLTNFLALILWNSSRDGKFYINSIVFAKKN